MVVFRKPAARNKDKPVVGNPKHSFLQIAKYQRSDLQVEEARHLLDILEDRN
jgi:hypothetical protein